MKIDAKVAVVTGATRGIGLAVARRFHEVDIIVVIVGRDSGLVKKISDEIGTSDIPAIGITTDVRKPEDVERMVGTTVDKFGHLDILVNNAGIIRDNIIFNTSLEDWTDVIETNLTGPFLCTKYAAKEMILRKYGRIINISSIAGERGGAGQSSYAASKSGLNAFTRIAAVELGRKNITVNAIAPGSIQTQMSDDLLKKSRKEILPRIPLKRIGKPDDVAGTALFLTSDEAAYVTGQILYVTGGLGVTYKV